ncbi:MAG TPA: alanine--tRNA ligase [Gammaproteobacteria bacterium]|nr:alanine--tRNA ligase [Gammaproteobacteria bacterium]
MSLTSSQLRQAFLDFFAKHGHRVVPSSSLVPGNDPTLLFTNAGMVQFKDCFLGKDKRDYVRAASSQRCVRAGGKHNDLENVGYTARHHTFFEMLGNFSFGDYFKKDAIRFAWDFVTGTLKIDPKRLMVTVYATDDEAYDLWHKMIGLPADKIVRIGDNKADGGSDNFWQMGDTGPCGPCTEIFYDHGPQVAGGPPGSADADGDRWVEIWNLVFMQFDRSADGKLTPLPKPSVDTGAGLERIAAVMQGVTNNYDIDLFVELIREAARLLGTNDYKNPSLRVIADHIRACSFLVVDGVIPSNEGRGYVLRRIARRAMRHGYKFGVSPAFFHELVPTLAKVMGGAYPELVAKQKFVAEVLLKEGEQFARTLETGMEILDAAIGKLGNNKIIDGNTVFKLHDTYGFPTDLTADIARERGLTIDTEGYERAMDVQRKQSQAASQFGVDLSAASAKIDLKTEFLGYELLVSDAPIVALLDSEGNAVQALEAGAAGTVVLERTPFYAESGGQVGDSGVLSSGAARFDVADTKKVGTAFGHHGKVTVGRVAIGDRVQAQVDAKRRASIVLNHSATHLLHAALRKVLGAHVQQKGSLVEPDRLRFDFSHFEPVSAEQLKEIEALVNEQVRLNHGADIQELPYEQAIAAGALAFFGDKYGDKVRVLKLGEFSTELCGGTHVARSGDIGLFKIVSEGGIAAGVRRIEAVTGQGALDVVSANEAVLREVASLVKANRDDVAAKVTQLVERARSLERELQTLRQKLASGGGRDILKEAKVVNGINVLVARLDGADAKALRDTADQLKSKLGSAVVVLGAVEGDKVFLVASVTQDLAGRLKAGEIIKPIAELCGGRGGGRADFAQAGGTKPDKVDAALALVPELIAAA